MAQASGISIPCKKYSKKKEKKRTKQKQNKIKKENTLKLFVNSEELPSPHSSLSFYLCVSAPV